MDIQAKTIAIRTLYICNIVLGGTKRSLVLLGCENVDSYQSPTQEAITGSEVPSEVSSPINALSQFYHAFNTGNLNEMSENWAYSIDISMDNPLGGVKRGWNQVRDVYDTIFNGPSKVYVEFYDYSIHESETIFFAVGRERGYFRKGDNEIQLEIRTSRVFKKTDGSWKQVHHHGSIEDPILLETYQMAVKGR